MGVRSWILERVLAGEIDRRVALAVKVLDGDQDRYWTASGAGADKRRRSWWQRKAELEELFELWRDNPLARRLVALTTDYCLGEDGFAVTSEIPSVAAWIDTFWAANDMERRLRVVSDELGRAGEVFVVLSRDKADGRQHVRLVPAVLIDLVETDANDYERELRYRQKLVGVEREVWWPAHDPLDVSPDQVMLHFAVNRAPGLVRGEPDLSAVIDELKHYDEWLKDRARVNRLKSAFVWDVKIMGAGAPVIKAKQAQYGRPPSAGSVIIHNENEEWSAVQPRIEAEDAEADGKALRLAVAAGAGVPLHFLSEGESATRATAAEMGDPTYRRLERRQDELAEIAAGVVEAGYQRSGRRQFSDLKIRVQRPRVARVDAESLGRAARMTVEALATMRERGWITDEMGAALALRSLSVVLDNDEIARIIKEAGVEPAGEVSDERKADLPGDSDSGGG